MQGAVICSIHAKRHGSVEEKGALEAAGGVSSGRKVREARVKCFAALYACMYEKYSSR